MHTQSCPNLLQPHGLEFTRPLHPRDFPGKNTGVGCHFFLQGIFPTQVSNLCLISPALAGRFLTTVPAGKHINKLKPAPNALGHRRNNTQLRKWQPTAVFLPGKSHGQRNLAAYSPWSPKESGWIEQLTHTVWGKQQKYHRHNRFEFDTINDKEDTLLGSQQEQMHSDIQISGTSKEVHSVGMVTEQGMWKKGEDYNNWNWKVKIEHRPR